MNNPFVIERVYNAPIEKVWSAITNVNEMKKWYFDVPMFKPEVGNLFSFSGGPDEGKQYLHLCEVKEIVEGQKISYTWRYDGYEGNSLVTFELFKEGTKTRLKLTHDGLDTFPATNPDLARKNFEMGWTEIIGNSLSNYLAANT